MAATNVFVAQDVPLQLGEDNWECWCSSIELTPDQTMTDVTPLCSDEVRQLPGPITWTLDITYYQDWTSGGTTATNGTPPGNGGGGGGDGGNGEDIETAAARAAGQDGISEWLFDHWGEEMPFAIGPAQDGGAVLTGICKIVAGAFGASSGDVAEGSVSMPAWNIHKIPGPEVEAAGLSKGASWAKWQGANSRGTIVPGAKAAGGAAVTAPVTRSRSTRVTTPRPAVVGGPA